MPWTARSRPCVPIHATQPTNSETCSQHSDAALHGVTRKDQRGCEMATKPSDPSTVAAFAAHIEAVDRDVDRRFRAHSVELRLNACWQAVADVPPGTPYVSRKDPSLPNPAEAEENRRYHQAVGLAVQA